MQTLKILQKMRWTTAPASRRIHGECETYVSMLQKISIKFMELSSKKKFAWFWSIEFGNKTKEIWDRILKFWTEPVTTREITRKISLNFFSSVNYYTYFRSVIEKFLFSWAMLMHDHEYDIYSLYTILANTYLYCTIYV